MDIETHTTILTYMKVSNKDQIQLFLFYMLVVRERRIKIVS